METFNKYLSILLVDDSELITNRIARLVNEVEIEHSMRVAGNFEEAIKIYNSGSFDVVILDIQLPDKSGIELLRYIKQRFSTSKVIMMTNQATQHYKRKCAALGADYFIDKSVEFEKIPLLLKDMADQHRENKLPFSDN